MLDHDPLPKEFADFFRSFFRYFSTRLRDSGKFFEKGKDFVVDVLLVRRGANASLFVHISIVVIAIGALAAGGVLSSGSIVSGSFPGVGANPLVAGAATNADAGIISSTITPVTVISDKPRDKTIDYMVKSGDTVTSIAKEYGISENTILWANDLTGDSQIKAGDKLKVLPVTGVSYKVESGDTIYSIAKKYQANAQAILDFKFNDIGDDFGVTTGQTLIIPDGAPPEKPKPVPTQYLATIQQNLTVQNLGTAQFLWPTGPIQQISQFFSWYHPGIDMANLGGGPIKASDSGTVTVAGFIDSSGYGNRVIIDHGNGFTTLYAHLSANYVSAGQKVSKGDVIGTMGSTGRSTGVHLHFEIHKDGASLNPLAFISK